MAATRALQAGGPIRMLDETQRFEIVGGTGLEWRAGFEAVDEMRNDAIEARLIAQRRNRSGWLRGVAPWRCNTRVGESGARLAAVRLPEDRGTRGIAARHHRCP